jgi:hypothetical protein
LRSFGQLKQLWEARTGDPETDMPDAPVAPPDAMATDHTPAAEMPPPNQPAPPIEDPRSTPELGSEAAPEPH